MAEAAKKVPETKIAENVAVPQEAPKDVPKRDLMNVIILSVVCINLLLVGGLGMFVGKMWGRVGELQLKADKPVVAEPEADHGDDKHKEKEIGKELQPAAQGTLYPMESFLVNISSDQGPKFLQTQMELELSDPSLEDEVTRKKAALRDAVIVLLSSKNYKELKEPSGMRVLRSDILKSLNALLATGKIKEIFFTQFHFN